MTARTVTPRGADGKLGEPVEGVEYIHDGAPLVAHRVGEIWFITEPTTGCRLGKGETENAAFVNAVGRIREHGGMPGFHKAIERWLDWIKRQTPEPTMQVVETAVVP